MIPLIHWDQFWHEVTQALAWRLLAIAYEMTDPVLAEKEWGLGEDDRLDGIQQLLHGVQIDTGMLFPLDP